MPAPIPNSAPAKELRDVSVLVIDDDRRIAKLVRSVLTGLGFQHIDVRHDGADAIALLKTQSVDLVICDWQMEPVNGLDFIRHVRHKKGPNQRVPVIMLSGNTELPQVETARDAGVTEYVMKPFTAKSLCSRIVTVIDNPRSFVESEQFAGHNRRRKKLDVPHERRKKRPKSG